MTTHAQQAAKAKTSTPCSAHHAKIGGGCFNCGWEPATIGTRVKVVSVPPSRTWAKPESWAQIKNASGIIKRVRTRPGEPTTFLFVPDPERTEERTNTGNDGWWLSEDEFES